LQARGEIFMASAVAARLGVALLAQGKCKASLRYAHMSRILAAPDNRTVQTQWRTVRARVLARADRTKAAERVALQAIAQADETDMPNLQADAYATLADVLQHARRVDEATGAAQKALSLYLGKENIAAADSLRITFCDLA